MAVQSLWANFHERDGDDHRFVACATHVTKAPARALVDRLFSQHRALTGDPHFLDQLRRDFAAKVWEMVVADRFLARGYPLGKPPADAPDVCVARKRKRIWIECVVPTAGTGEDAVILRKAGDRFPSRLPDDKLMLRYASSIRDKVGQLKAHEKKGHVRPEDAVVLAISQAKLTDSDINDPIVPLVVKTLFGIGTEALHVPIDRVLDARPPRVEFPRLEGLIKRRGAQVPLNVFQTADAQILSGVLFSSRAIWEESDPPGSDFRFVHNPYARVPLGKRLIPYRCEFWVQGDRLVWRGKPGRA